MSAPAPVAARLLRFENFELDLYAGELRKRGVRQRLQGQPIQVLAILLQSAGQLVTREEIRKQIWPADTFVDFDHSLHNAVGRIREVLGDSAESPRYIETLPRRGYRFIAPVEEVPLRPSAPVVEIRKAAEPATQDSSKRLTRNLAIGAVCLAIVMVSLAAWRYFTRVPAIHSIAVLPLQNLSNDPAQEYFADGMTEELITEMSRIQSLRVISRTSITEYKGTRKHLPQIARELGVDAIVEGSVIREGDQIRVTVQLLDGPHDRHLWSEDYQRPLHGILNLQKDIAEAIAQQIRARLTEEQKAQARRSSPVDPEAYDAYLRGRFYIDADFSKKDMLERSRDYFEQAVRKDPSFALAYSGLAEAYLNLALYRHLSPEAAYTATKDAVRKAENLDDSLGEVHSILAVLAWQFERDFGKADREFAYSIALAPSYDCARAYHALYLARKGQRAEALAEFTKARELNPGTSFSSTESAIYFQLRDYPKLVEASEKGVVSDPNDWLERYFLGTGYDGLGRRAEAIAAYQKAIEMSGGDQDAIAGLAHAYALSGRRADAEKILHDLERQSKERYVSSYAMASVYAALDDKDKAFEWLEKAYAERDLDLVWNFRCDQRIDSLRSDPRFASLLRRIGDPAGTT